LVLEREIIPIFKEGLLHYKKITLIICHHIINIIKKGKNEKYHN